MSQTVVFIHTVPPLLPVFAQLGAELLPGVKVFHILDEPLIERVRRRGVWRRRTRRGWRRMWRPRPGSAPTPCSSPAPPSRRAWMMSAPPRRCRC